jgi:hypothetical protein
LIQSFFCWLTKLSSPIQNAPIPTRPPFAFLHKTSKRISFGSAWRDETGEKRAAPTRDKFTGPTLAGVAGNILGTIPDAVMGWLWRKDKMKSEPGGHEELASKLWRNSMPVCCFVDGQLEWSGF